MGITTCRLEGPVDFYSVGQFVSGPGWRHMRRTIDTFELMFVRRGVLPMRVGERTLHIEAGQIALLPPNVEHAGVDIISLTWTSTGCISNWRMRVRFPMTQICRKTIIACCYPMNAPCPIPTDWR